MTDPQPDYEPPRSPFASRGFLVGAGLIAVVVVLGIVVVASRAGNGNQAPRSGPATSSTPPAAVGASAAPGASAAAGGCNLPAGGQQVPESPPSGVTWQLYQSVALPYSASAGPAVTQGDVARCYAHDPAGALLAATQIGVRYLLAGNWRAVLAEQVMPGAGPAAYTRLRLQAGGSAGQPGGSGQPGGYGQFAAFQFVTYSPQTAVIELVSRFSDGSMQQVTETVVWSGGDWKLVLQPDGSAAPNAQQVPNVVGYVAWGGV